jgi:hypothetical protein
MVLTWSGGLKLSLEKADFEGRRYHAYYGMDKNLLPTDEV